MTANCVLSISDAASLAIHAMTLLAGAADGAAVRVSEMAETLGVSEAHLGKVMQRLGRVGLVVSRRGPKGGFSLRRAAEEVLLLDVLEAIDGPFSDSECLLDRGSCPLKICVMGDVIGGVYRDVHGYFSRTRLADLRP